MANEENHEDDKASWTIKSMPVESRKMAVAAAARAGESMAVWLDRAVRTQVKIEAGQEREQPSSGRGAPPPSGAPILSGAELEGLAALIGQSLAMATQAGEPVPKARARETFALLAAQVRAARGLPPPKPRKRPPNGPTTIEPNGSELTGLPLRQTQPPNGQTVLEDGSTD